MAIDVCSEISSAGISPRISFSHDLNQTNEDDVSTGRLDSSLLDSDFDFCIGSNFVQELSSADELFSNGKILPIAIKKPKPVSSTPNQTTNAEKKQLREFLSMSIDDEKPCKTFWQFKRSNSLNCDSTSRSKGIIRSFQFLSRSNSTGSAPNPPKQPVLPKETHKPRLQKQHSAPAGKSRAATFSGAFYPYNSGQQKSPALRKCGSYGNGVRINPVLNIPPPYISRGTVNLFGLGSLFCNGKVKTKKR